MNYEPNIVLDFSKDLSTEKIYFGADLNLPPDERAVLLEIKKPSLTWDVNKIKGSFAGIIQSMFSPGDTAVVYDGVPIIWLGGGLFPTSIDSMFLLQTLDKEGYFKKPDLESVIDMGAGVGVIGLHSMIKNTNIKKVYAVDVQGISEEAVRVNAENNGINDGVEFYLSDCFDNPEIPGADLVLCNPPYIPFPDFMKDEGSNPFQGTYLIKRTLKDFKEYAPELIILTSSVCDKEFKELNNELGLKPELLAEREVPARFTFLSKEWRDWLEKRGGYDVQNKIDGWPSHVIKVHKY